MKAIRRRWQCNAVVCYTLSCGCLGALSIMGRKLPGCPTSRIGNRLHVPLRNILGNFLYFPPYTIIPPYTAINLDEFSTLHYYSALHSY